MDDVDPECVHCVPADVVPVDARDEHLALVVVAEEAPDHGGGGGSGGGGGGGGVRCSSPTGR